MSPVFFGSNSPLAVKRLKREVVLYKDMRNSSSVNKMTRHSDTIRDGHRYKKAKTKNVARDVKEEVNLERLKQHYLPLLSFNADVTAYVVLN